jgi:hypothetical protein
MTARQNVLLFPGITGSKRQPRPRPVGPARVIHLRARRRPGDQAAALLFLLEWDRRRWQAERKRELSCYQIPSQKVDTMTTNRPQGRAQGG